MTDITKKLDTDTLTIFEWFQMNYLNVRSEKSQVILTANDKLKINAAGSLISNETTAKLLGMTIDNTPSFETHLNTVC